MILTPADSIFKLRASFIDAAGRYARTPIRAVTIEEPQGEHRTLRVCLADAIEQHARAEFSMLCSRAASLVGLPDQGEGAEAAWLAFVAKNAPIRRPERHGEWVNAAPDESGDEFVWFDALAASIAALDAVQPPPVAAQSLHPDIRILLGILATSGRPLTLKDLVPASVRKGGPKDAKTIRDRLDTAAASGLVVLPPPRKQSGVSITDAGLAAIA